MILQESRERKPAIRVGKLAQTGLSPADQPAFVTHVYEAPDLASLNLAIAQPAERKDQGAIEYTTIPEAIHNWAEDPRGMQKLHFLSDAYGIPKEDLRDVLEEAGLGEYLQHKAEGRMIGMVSTQVQKPTYYFLSNVFMLAELNRRGIPTSLMVLEYGEDKFHAGNADKRGAFGKVNFPVHIERKTNNKEEETIRTKSVSIELQPYGVREDDETVRRINTIDEANGYRCDQVLAKIVDARGPENQRYTIDYEDKTSTGKLTKTKYEAALGLHIPGVINTEGDQDQPAEHYVSITDFYRTLWIETINRLRECGEIPSEEEMPMFFVDGLKLYSTIGRKAQPPQEVLDTIAVSKEKDVLQTIFRLPEDDATKILQSGRSGFEDYLASRNLTQLPNGLLIHENGMLDPSCYYIAQTALPDLYLECSSCGGDEFVGKLKRAQDVRKKWGLAESEVRIPDQEVPHLEQLVVHPTGQYLELNHRPDPRVIELNEGITTIFELGKTGAFPKRVAKEMTGPFYDEIAARRISERGRYNRKLEDLNPDHFATTNVVYPPEVAATYSHFLQGVHEAIAADKVQQALARL